MVAKRQRMRLKSLHAEQRGTLTARTYRSYSRGPAQPPAGQGRRRDLGQARELTIPGGSVKDRICLAMIEARRARRAAQARRHDRRADLGQHRNRTRAGGGRQGLQAHPDDARYDERGAALAAGRLWRAPGTDTGYARHARCDRQGRGAGARQPGLSSCRSSSATRPIPTMHHTTTGPELVEPTRTNRRVRGRRRHRRHDHRRRALSA